MADRIVGKHQIEKALYEEKKEISAGRLKEENPLDTSDEFREFCEACRRGHLKACQEAISTGININARDAYDYTPLILVSTRLLLLLRGKPYISVFPCTRLVHW